MPEGEKYTVVGGRGVIVREAPAMDSYVVGELRKGTTVWIDGGRAIDGGAYRAHMVAPLEGYVTLKATLLERCPEAPAVAQGRQRAAAAEAAQKRAAAAAPSTPPKLSLVDGPPPHSECVTPQLYLV